MAIKGHAPSGVYSDDGTRLLGLEGPNGVIDAIAGQYASPAELLTAFANGQLFGSHSQVNIYTAGGIQYLFDGTVLTPLTNNPNLDSMAVIAFPEEITGGNFSYTNSSSAGSVPTPIRPDGYADVILPAQAGDIIEYTFSGRVNTSSNSGLILSCWSIGGSSYRDWTSDIMVLQSVSGFLIIPASNTMVNGVSVINTVKSSDIDFNGNVTLRLYGANSTGSGPDTHVFPVPGNGSIPIIIGKNHRQFVPKQYQETTVYPSGSVGIDEVFTTLNGAFGIPIPVNASGVFDIVLNANVLDIIQVYLHGRVTTSGNPVRFSLWSMVNGQPVRSWTDALSFSNSPNSSIGDVPGGTSTMDFFSAQRVLSSDLQNGTLILRLYATVAGGNAGQSHTLLGSDDAGGVTYMTGTNLGSGFQYALVATENWEGSTDLQEPSVYWDGQKMNMIFSASGANNGNGATGWATAPHPLGPWTEYALNPIIGNGSGGESGKALRNSILQYNGNIYIYYADENDQIKCAYGSSPTLLTNAGNVLNSPAGISSLENTCVIGGPGGTFYMFFEGLAATGTTWEPGVATATNPLGPFTVLQFPLNSLQIANGAAYGGGPWLEWTGRYFRGLFHNCPDANSLLPTNLYAAKSTDGVNWEYSSIKQDGSAAALLMPMTELGMDQVADPSFVRFNGQVYVFFTINSNSNLGGIGVTKPLSTPIYMGF